jgi:predicted nucleic acid-binding Zn ribbon protein
MPPLSARIRRTPRQKTLAAWRGIDLTEEERARANTVKTASDLMPAVLNGIRLERKLSDLEIVKVWNHLIDPVVVAHAKPAGLAKGTLFVNVDSNAWLDEIVRYRRKEILRLLRHSFGPDLIQKISFRVA